MENYEESKEKPKSKGNLKNKKKLRFLSESQDLSSSTNFISSISGEKVSNLSNMHQLIGLKMRQLQKYKRRETKRRTSLKIIS